MDEKKIRPVACLELSRRIFQQLAKPYLLAASASASASSEGGAEQMEATGSGSTVSAEEMVAGEKLVSLLEKMAASDKRILDQVAACTTLPLHRCPHYAATLTKRSASDSALGPW